MSEPRVTIVIPVHNALDYFRDCLRTVIEHTQKGMYRLVLVDDYSDTPTEAFLRSVAGINPGTLLIRTAQQKWFTRASNIGLRLVKTPFALLLNSDCVVNAGWLEELHGVYDAYLAENPSHRVGLVGSVLWQESPDRWLATRVEKESYTTGHCLLLNMKAMEDLAISRGTPGWYFNELDEGQVHIASDRLMNWDLNRIGYQTLTAYHACVGHHGGKSWDYDLGAVSRLRLADFK